MRLADHVVEKLLALVQERGLQPGQKLPAERQLAEELGVSRTSVRGPRAEMRLSGVARAKNRRPFARPPSRLPRGASPRR